MIQSFMMPSDDEEAAAAAKASKKAEARGIEQVTPGSTPVTPLKSKLS